MQNVAIARENFRRHAWGRALVEGLRQEVAYALQQDRSFFERMIPTLTPWPEYGQNCPACVDRLSAMGETGLYEWDIRDPERLVCTYCKTEYPNVDYPETGSIAASRMGQTFSFYLNDDERAHPEDTTGKHAYRWVTFPVHTSWSGVLRSKQGRWCLDQVLPLARLYALTDDIAAAERAAWILDIAARRYPNWLFHSYDGTYADCPPAEVAKELGRHPHGGHFPHETIITAFAGRHREGDHSALFNGFWGAGRFGCSGGDAGILLKLTLAYELICDAIDADGRALLAGETGDCIRDDLILAGCDDMECWNEINNKCPPGRALSALVGRLFGRPESVRRAIEGFEALLEKGFHRDGFCTESPSYSDMFLNLMRPIPDLLAGYSDPEDYVPKSGQQLVDFDPYARFARYRLALESMIRMLDPNRSYPVIGDTHFGGGLLPIHAEVLTAHYGSHYAGLLEQTLGAPLAEAGDEYALWFRDPDLEVKAPTPLPLQSEWFPGWQVGVLRGGEEAAGDTAFYFNGYAQGGHRHTDTLGISYIAHHTELAADRGYIWDDPRGAWTKGTLAHNIVTVDGEKQNHPDRQSTLELFGRGPGVEMVQASALAYAQCDLYRRTSVLVRYPDGGTYAVDFSRVTGGQTHHYGFHCNGALTGVEGADFAPLNGDAAPAEWLQWVERPQVARPTQMVKATWACDGVHMDLHLLSDMDRLLLADAPGWRSCHGSQLNAPPVQQILAERGGEHVVSDYAAVMVPYKNAASPVKGVRLLAAQSGVLAVEVSFADRTDYILSNSDDAEHTFGPITVSGRFAYVALAGDGEPVRAYLLDGTRLKYGNMECSLPCGRTELAIASIEDRTLRLAQEVPDGLLASVEYVLIGGTGYDIEEITGDVIRVRDYPLVGGEVVTLLHGVAWER